LPGQQGRAMRRMVRIGGRSDDMLIVRGVNVFPSQIEEQILRCAGLAPHYLIEVARPGRIDEVKVLVECREGAEGAVGTAAVADFIHHVKDIVGIAIAVELKPPGTLDRSQGKAKRVIDRRPKD